MKEEEYEDYLVDKAKELLDEQTSDVPDEDEKPGLEKKVDEKEDSKIPFSWDPREVEHMARNRKSMTNKKMKEIMENDSDFQENLEDIDDWKGFSRWEERLLIQRHGDQTVEELAAELDREEKEVKVKMQMMGFKPDE